MSKHLLRSIRVVGVLAIALNFGACQFSFNVLQAQDDLQKSDLSKDPQAMKKLIERINKLIRETMREPFSGVGKPEPLKHVLAGFWSRRITEEHRMVYKIDGDALLIAQLRYHY